ncbi:putative transcription factor [Hordeum vulgare]|nr:putative transcription factor [Hordeum vulgare]
MDLHIHQLYFQLLYGQDDPNSPPPPFFQPPPPQAPIMGDMGGYQWPADPVAMMPMQTVYAGNASGLAPATLAPGEGSLTAGGDAFLGDDHLVHGLEDDPVAMMPMQRVCAGNASGLAPGEGSMMAGGDAFLGDDHLVHGLDEDSLAFMSMTGAELSAFLSDEPAGSSLCVPPECLIRSLPVPPAGGASQPASGSPGLGSAQVMRATDSPASGVVDPLMRMTQSPSVSPCLGSAPQVMRGTDSPASGVVDPLTRMTGDGLSAFLSDGAAVNSLFVPPECLMNSLVAYQPAMGDSPSVHPADGPSQSFSGSPGLGCDQARAADSAPPAAYIDGTQLQVPDSVTAEVAQMVRVAERCGDMPSTAWSMEEDQLLLQDLSRFAGQDNVRQCFIVASQLPEKTALDVAYRIRWMTDLEKKKAAKELQLGQEKSAGANVTNLKVIALAAQHVLPNALDSRSVKDIIRDNNRLMDKIEEILRTGEVKNCPDYFYYVKMNMDAMQNKVKDLGSVMEGLSVGDEEWEDVLKDRDAPMNVDKLKKMAGAVRTGGKGSVRRKKKAVHKTTTTDDKRLQSTLKRVGVNTIPGIEEVNIFKDDVVIQFQNPKVQASIAANTWVVSGTPQTKKLQDLLPTIINQLGPDNLDNLRRLAEQFQKQMPGAEGGASIGAAQDDDDDVPELVPGETFEEAAEEKKAPEAKKEAEPEEKKESS